MAINIYISQQPPDTLDIMQWGMLVVIALSRKETNAKLNVDFLLC